MLLSFGATSSLILLLSLHSGASCYKILGLFPVPLKSHYLTFDPLMLALAERGHQVTVYDTFVKDPKVDTPNYAEVDLSRCFKIATSSLTIENMNSANDEKAIVLAFEKYLPSENDILTCEPLLQLANSTERYDLMITEAYFSDFFVTLAHKLKVPVVQLRCNTVLPWMSSFAGIPHNPSYIPFIYSAYSTDMTFFQRLKNTFYYLQALYLYEYRSARVYDEVASKFFGTSVPSIDELTRNASMLLLNTHFTLNEVRPLPPNVVEIGGLHLLPVKPLPQNIEKFINESEHGVIYFCMGSLLRGNSFDAQKRRALVEAFSQTRQRVLWKWEGDFPDKPENIMTLDWAPQRDILAHPNVKLFISHGGLLGTYEAAYGGVPVLGIPIFVDQKHNIKNLEDRGVAVSLEYNDITASLVLEKLRTLMEDPRYQARAKELASRLQDRPQSPMDTAIYWTEYVIRHQGAHHLKTAAVRMPWYQYLLLDVIASIVFTLVSVLFLVWRSIKWIASLVSGSPAVGKSNSSNITKSKKKKNKKN